MWADSLDEGDFQTYYNVISNEKSRLQASLLRIKSINNVVCNYTYKSCEVYKLSLLELTKNTTFCRAESGFNATLSTLRIVAAVGNSRTENQEYNLARSTKISFVDIVNTILKQLNRTVLKINVNTNLAAKIVKYAQYIPGFTITEKQVFRLKEDKVFDISKAIK